MVICGLVRSPPAGAGRGGAPGRTRRDADGAGGDGQGAEDDDGLGTIPAGHPSGRDLDYLLGGKDNYPADRAVAEAMIAQLPNVRPSVQWNRAFLRRVVRYLVTEAGIRQIIDIGAGLPTVGNTRGGAGRRPRHPGGLRRP